MQEATYALAVITFVQLLFFAVYLVILKKGKRTSHRLLAAFLFVNSIIFLNYLTHVFFQDFRRANPFLIYAFSSANFLFGPLLYFYSTSLTQKGFKLSRVSSAHLIPFIASFLFLSFRYVSSHGGNSIVDENTYLIFNTAFNIQVTVYLLLTLLELQRYSDVVKKFHSSIYELSLSWLWIIIAGYLLMWMVDLASFIYGRITTPAEFIRHIFTFISVAINFVFANAIIYKGLRHPEVLLDLNKMKSAVKYDHAAIDQNEADEYANRLLSHMADAKPYLNPSLTLDELAKGINITSRVLSRIINENLNKNFYDFVNSFRIEEAKRIFESENGRHKTVLEILYQVGFNSKSSFNTAFKKHTGVTPTEFRSIR